MRAVRVPRARFSPRLVLAAGQSSASPRRRPLPRIGARAASRGVRTARLAQAYDEALAHPDDAVRVGQLGMVLQAWEQFDTAAVVYASARGLERRFEWFYLGGLVEARLGALRGRSRLLSRCREAFARRLPAPAGARGCALRRPATPTRPAQSTRPLDRAGPARRTRTTVSGGQLDATGDDEGGAGAIWRPRVELYPEFGAAWYAPGMALRNLGRMDEARAVTRARPGSSEHAGRPWTIRSWREVRALRDDADAHAERGLALRRQAT